MENTKIQMLWKMCLELKDKRQSLLDQWRSTQSYLDEKQMLLAQEFQHLRTQNHDLGTEVQTLCTQLNEFRRDWKGYFGEFHELQHAFGSLGNAYRDLNKSFTQLYRELTELNQELQSLTHADPYRDWERSEERRVGKEC